MSGSAELSARAQNSSLSATSLPAPSLALWSCSGLLCPQKGHGPKARLGSRGLPVTCSSRVASQVVPLFRDGSPQPLPSLKPQVTQPVFALSEPPTLSPLPGSPDIDTTNQPSWNPPVTPTSPHPYPLPGHCRSPSAVDLPLLRLLMACFITQQPDRTF